MSVAELLVDVMGPVVVVVALGYTFGRRRPLDIATLSSLSFWVLGPAFVFDVFVGAELARDTIVRVVVAGWAGMAGAIAVAAGLAHLAGYSSLRRSAVMMTSGYGNVGNAGLAMSVFAFGDDAAPIAAVLMILINGTGMTLGVALGSVAEHGVGPAIRRGLTAPMTVAAALAVIANVTDMGFPIIAERSISLVGGALIPIMLLTLGMQLAAHRRFELESDVGIAGLGKLAVAPLVAAGVGRALGLDGDVFGVLVLQSAMPPAVFCAVVALEYDLAPDRVSRTVLGSTLLAMITLPIALVLVT